MRWSCLILLLLCGCSHTDGWEHPHLKGEAAERVASLCDNEQATIYLIIGATIGYEYAPAMSYATYEECMKKYGFFRREK